MSSSNSFPKPYLVLRPSRLLMAWYVAMSTALLCFAVYVSIRFGLLLALALVCYGAILLLVRWRGQILLQGPRAVTALRFQDEKWWLMDGDQCWRDYELMANSFLSPICCLLHFKDLEKSKFAAKRTLVLMADCADKDSLRRLRVFIKFYQPREEEEPTKLAS